MGVGGRGEESRDGGAPLLMESDLPNSIELGRIDEGRDVVGEGFSSVKEYLVSRLFPLEW